MSKIHASCFECEKGGAGGWEACTGVGVGRGVVEEKAFHEVMAHFRKIPLCFLSPSPLGGGLSFLIYKEGEENESSLNKNSKGHFYVRA